MATTVKPMTIHVPQDVLDDLHERLARTRWPEAVPEGGWTRGGIDDSAASRVALARLQQRTG